MGFTRLVKGLWYFALGLTYLTGTVGAETVVIYICFIEAFDLFFQQYEVRRERQQAAQVSRNGALGADANDSSPKHDTGRLR
jgi:hypothetical protein